MIGAATLRHEVRGAAGLIFTLSLVPLLGFLALAIDFGTATLARTQVDLAADSAALKAVTAASAAYLADPTSNYLATGQAAGVAFFQAQLGKMVFGTAGTPTVTVTGSNGTFSATVSVQARLPLSFAGVIGFGSLNISGSSAATLTNPKYVAIQILVDTSASMGILTDTTNNPLTLFNDTLAYIRSKYGTTAPASGDLLVSSAAYNNLISLNNYTITDLSAASGACAFACHNDNTTGGPGGRSNDIYGIAEANGLQLRIDVLRGAVQEIIQDVQDSDNAQYFQFGIYGFSTSLTTIFALSSNLSAAYTAASNINVTPVTPYCSYSGSPPLCGQPSTAANGPNGNFRTGAVPNTKFEPSVTQLIAETLTPAPTATGVSPATAQRYMFIITDGVDDYTTNATLNYACCNQLIYPFNATNGTSGGSPASPDVCDQIKAAGVTILVLYTPYDPVPVATYYNDVEPIVTPLADSAVTRALQACASNAADFFQASSATEIQAALNQMLAIASAQVGTLTQ